MSLRKRIHVTKNNVANYTVLTGFRYYQPSSEMLSRQVFIKVNSLPTAPFFGVYLHSGNDGELHRGVQGGR
jgi:tRNA-binding EMAP/Myf-like protein